MVALDVTDLVLANDFSDFIAQSVFVLGVASTENFVNPIGDHGFHGSSQVLILAMNIGNDSELHMDY